jgi:hypothetical protein
MKITAYGKSYRLMIPARFNEDGKRQAKYFKTKEEGEIEIRRILGRGASGKPAIDDYKLSILTIAERELGSIDQILEAIRHYRATVLNVSKRAHLFDLVEKFLERQAHEGRAPRTLDDDRQRLNKLCMSFENIDVCRLTQTGLRQ